MYVDLITPLIPVRCAPPGSHCPYREQSSSYFAGSGVETTYQSLRRSNCYPSRKIHPELEDIALVVIDDMLYIAQHHAKDPKGS